MRVRLHAILFTFSLLYSLTTFGQSNKSNNYWLSFTTKGKCGYINENGDTEIKANNRFCFTDTFRIYAIVLNENSQFVAMFSRLTTGLTMRLKAFFEF